MRYEAILLLCALTADLGRGIRFSTIEKMESQRSFYGRPLPSECVAFRSKEGIKRFQEASNDGTLGSYFALSDQFQTQNEPAFCGLTSLVMVLNALSVDPRRQWKGPWRWYAESLLECCEPLEVVKVKGVTMDKLACTARCNSLETEIVRFADKGFEETLRKNILRVVSQAPENPSEFMIAAYSRKRLGQTGNGHFSPLAAYHQASDSVLILDTARFKYPSHWVSLAALADSMSDIDQDTQKSRGFLLLSRRLNIPGNPLSIDCPVFSLSFDPNKNKCTRQTTTTSLSEEIRALKHNHTVHTDTLTQTALYRLEYLVHQKSLLPRAAIFEFACCGTITTDQATNLLKAAATTLASSTSNPSAIATLFSVPPAVWPLLLPDLNATEHSTLIKAINTALPPELQPHIENLRQKFSTYVDFELGGSLP